MVPWFYPTKIEPRSRISEYHFIFTTKQCRLGLVLLRYLVQTWTIIRIEFGLWTHLVDKELLDGIWGGLGRHIRGWKVSPGAGPHEGGRPQRGARRQHDGKWGIRRFRVRVYLQMARGRRETNLAQAGRRQRSYETFSCVSLNLS